MHKCLDEMMTLQKRTSLYRQVRAALCLLLVSGTVNVMAQTSLQETLQKQFVAYSKQTLQEKIFVHTDKNFYLAGEVCWFKLYTVDAFNNRPLGISTVAYAELLDQNNKPVLQAKIALKQGDGNGSWYIPVTVASGKYKLRAYTNWMKNFDAGYFFEKIITIVNARNTIETPAGKTTIKYEAQFFPEGGNLVNTVKSRVAFRITDQYGKGVEGNGVVIDDKGDTVARFSPARFGIGTFSMTPLAGKAYTSVITFKDSTKIIRELPKAYDKGYVMNLESLNDRQLEVTVQVPVTEIGKGSPLLYLFVHTRGMVKSVTTATLDGGAATFIIDKELPGDGVSQFTIFNSDKQPVCERLHFKYPSQKLVVKLGSDQAVYDTRKKVTLAINSDSQDGKPAMANMSMAVYRVDSLQTPDDISISDYLWLSADLAGTVESPGWYFRATGTEALTAMDNLMMTHGWRRFRWENVLQEQKPAFEFIPEHNGHIITGKLISTKTGTPEAGIGAYLSVPGLKPRFRSATSDASGKLKFEVKDFYGSSEIIVQTNTNQDSTQYVEINNPFAATFTTNPLPAFVMPVSSPGTLLDKSIGVQVQNVYGSAKINQFIDPGIDSNAFYFKPDYKYLLDDYTRFTTMEEVLREYVFPVNVKKRGSKYQLPVYNNADAYNSLFNDDPLVLIDGVAVFDMNKVMAYDPLKVRKLEVIARKYFLGKMAFDGIVNFNTYTGDLPGFELDPRATVIDYEALQLQREFYAPVYETTEQSASRLPDFRNLLYWSPTINTDATGKQQASFYSSDLKGKYVVVLQGLSPDGKAGSSNLFFEVK